MCLAFFTELLVIHLLVGTGGWVKHLLAVLLYCQHFFITANVLSLNNPGLLLLLSLLPATNRLVIYLGVYQHFNTQFQSSTVPLASCTTRRLICSCSPQSYSLTTRRFSDKSPCCPDCQSTNETISHALFDWLLPFISEYWLWFYTFCTFFLHYTPPFTDFRRHILLRDFMFHNVPVVIHYNTWIICAPAP